MSIEQMDAFELQQSIIDKKKELDELNSNVEKLSTEKKTLADKLNELSQKIDNANSTIEMQEYGLYEPKYDFATSLGYKEKLTEIRKNQKEMIRKKVAVDYREGWTVDGSKAKGTKMTNDSIKLVLRAFNNECEAAINKVKYSNYDSIQKRIERSYEQINKLTSVTQVSISYYYLNSKLEELALAYEYAKKKEQEKEELREQRQREREEKALQKEVAQKKKVIDKDITHYENVITELQEKLKNLTNDAEVKDINDQVAELNKKIDNLYSKNNFLS